MTVNRFDYGALYFVKRHYVFGVNFRDPSDDERRTLQSNKGVYVLTVVDGSPAFKADILSGDMIVAIDGVPVYGHQGCSDLLAQRRGRTVEVAILRGSQPITKSVALDN
jgi:S1-C subfamily serine protease